AKGLSMIGNARTQAPALAIGLGLALLAAPLLAQRPANVAWGPSREAAAIAEEPMMVGTGISKAQMVAEEISAGRRPAISVQRPSRLNPRDVGRMHTEY